MAKNDFRNKKVLVTGCCGTVGGELIRQLVEIYRAKEVIGIDNNESDIFFQEQKFASSPTHFFLADVRDKSALIRLFEDVDVIFHTAAYKHVSLCEQSPFEAVQTNITGVQNIISAAIHCGVKKVIFTSTDKAVNPTNVMGTSKLMGERLMTAANNCIKGKGPVFASTRFGNVLGSRGSVIPIFREQIRNGGPISLTDPKMTRFIMSIRQAVQLVIDSSTLCRGGEVFVTKMPVIQINDLAEVMIEELAQKFGFSKEKISIQHIGSKPGEKLYEELMTFEETRRALELPNYFVIHPAFSSLYRKVDYDYPSILNTNISNPYNSSNEKPLSQGELKEFLTEHNIMEGETDEEFKPKKRYWGKEYYAI